MQTKVQETNSQIEKWEDLKQAAPEQEIKIQRRIRRL
jgi:hypothetical protein